jgi:hypothetical protein
MQHKYDVITIVQNILRFEGANLEGIRSRAFIKQVSHSKGITWPKALEDVYGKHIIF